MHRDHARAPGTRPGFTLIEMTVVLGIILMLSVLTVLFMPRIQERQRVARGADFLQGWLLMAKQRALRDRIPTGVRLQPSAQNPNYVQDLQYIQKPDDYAQGGITPISGGNRVTFVGVDFWGAAKDTVQPGDYLLVRGEGLPSLITSVDSPTSLHVASTIHANLPQQGNTSYRILRQPRPLAGEQPLQLPQDVIIDLNARKSMNVPPRPPFGGEILFSPSGRVVGQGTGSAPIVLWLRDATQDANTPGDQLLIVIYPRTGLIAAHPVAEGADPYQFIRDGRSSGF